MIAYKVFYNGDCFSFSLPGGVDEGFEPSPAPAGFYLSATLMLRENDDGSVFDDYWYFFC